MAVAVRGWGEEGGFFDYVTKTAGPDGDESAYTTYSVGAVLRYDADETDVLSNTNNRGAFAAPVEGTEPGSAWTSASSRDDSSRTFVDVGATTRLLGRDLITTFTFGPRRRK